MKVALIGVRGDFTNKSADGVKRYMYELYKHLHSSHPSQVKKIEYKVLPFLYPGLSALPQSVFQDFNRYDIIHNLDPRPIMPLNKGNAALITTIHDFHGLLRPEKEDYASIRRRLGLKFVLQYGLKLALKNSDYLICNSTQTKSEAIKLGFDKGRISITPHGIDDRYIKTPLHTKKNKVFRVGYIGSLSKTKNVEFAIRAFKKIKLNNVMLEIWGKKDREYENLVKLAGCDKRIIFKGYAPEDQIVKIYDSFDVFVHPTMYEGFCLPIIEAMARGKPVITYKKAKIPKEVRRYAIEAKDSRHMARIIENLKEHKYSNRIRAMKYARQFTWARSARETFAVYKKAQINNY